MTTTSRAAYAALAGLTLVGSLAACATTTPSTGGGATSAPADDATPSPSSGSAAGDYADGSYTAEGQYQSPNGTESVEVTVTLENDVVTSVEVVSGATNPQSKFYQGQFIDGIADKVTGVDIDQLKVDRVAGSSLTSGGFNAAIEQIKADAAA